MDHISIPYGRHLVEEEDIEAVNAVLRGEWLTTGPAVTDFERNLAALCGGYPVAAVSSGTAALHSAYVGAGLGPGAELVTTPMTFAATAYLALHLGARVRFVDVCEDTLNLDPEAVASAVRGRTKVIATVDYAGHPSDLYELQVIATSVGAALVEDAAHALGGFYRGAPVGSCADFTTFSFHPVKTITTGEGGAVVVRQQEALDLIRRFRDHGMVRQEAELFSKDEGPWHQEIQSLGLNYRLSDIGAALGASQLRRLHGLVAKRTYLVERYRDLLSDTEGVQLLGQRDYVKPAWHLFVIRITEGRRKIVFDRLRAAGIGVQVHYLPAYLHPIFLEAGYVRGMCPVAESAYEEIISLPLFPALKESEQDFVVDRLRDAIGGSS